MSWCTAFLAAAMVFAVPDKNADTPPSSEPMAGVPVTGRINGAERIGWDQQAANSDELATLRYLIYIDNSATEVQKVSCTVAPGPSGYACTGHIPPMRVGQHVLSMSAYITRDGIRLESPRSGSITVMFVASAPPVTGAVSDSLTVVTSDGVHLRGTLVADNLVDPT